MRNRAALYWSKVKRNKTVLCCRERLASTLLGLCISGRGRNSCSSGMGTIILQAETRRIEGVLYGRYFEALREAGFMWAALYDDCAGEGAGWTACQQWEGCDVSTWVIWLPSAAVELPSALNLNP